MGDLGNKPAPRFIVVIVGVVAAVVAASYTVPALYFLHAGFMGGQIIVTMLVSIPLLLIGYLMWKIAYQMIRGRSVKSTLAVSEPFGRVLSKAIYGYLPLGRWKGVPVNVHWLTLVIIVLLFLTETTSVAWIGYLGLIFLHELGHAALVWRYGGEVIGIELHPLGGACRWYGAMSPLQTVLISWGGIAAQVILLAISVAYSILAGPATSNADISIRFIFTEFNLLMIVYNLLPIPPLDGATTWKIIPMLARRIARKSGSRALRSIEPRQSKKPSKKVRQSAHLQLIDAEKEAGLVLDELLSSREKYDA